MPQGSIVGSLLLHFHINALVRAAKMSRALMLADDTVIYTASQGINEIEMALTNEIVLQSFKLAR